MSKVVFFRFGEHALTAIVTLLIAYFSLIGATKQADVTLVDTLYVQVRDLEKKVFEQNALITQLRIELERKYETSQVLKSYIDAMPYPAWIKIVEVDERGNNVFVMWHINLAYESQFSVKRARYVGQTDFSIWPEDVAQQFFENDLKVLMTMDYSCKTESFPARALQAESQDNKTTNGYVCKWATKINGRTAIAGQIIELTERPH